MGRLCQPERIFWCDGSEQEDQMLCGLMVESGTLTKLNESCAPAANLARSHPSDVARVEDRTFICAKSRDEAVRPTTGPDPAGMKETLLVSSTAA